MAHDHRRDPEVRYLAEEQGVSLEVAVERIRWQGEAAQLRDQLRRDFPDSYVVLQVDPQDGDRLKLHLRDPSSAVLAAVKARLDARDILRATDIVIAPEPPTTPGEGGESPR